MEDSHRQVFDEERWEPLALDKETVLFSVEEGVSISDHINNYTKLLMDVANVDVVINDKDKALILLSSLPDESYETFVLTLINRRTSLRYGSYYCSC